MATFSRRSAWALYALIVAIIVFCCAAAPATAATDETPHGTYAFGRSDLPIPDLPAFVGGVTLTSSWALVEPSPGVFDWSLFDRGIAQAAASGRTVMLGVVPGVRSPAWLYAANGTSGGARYISMTWTLGWGFAKCSTQRLPLPWDAVYQREWGNLVIALADRYGGEASVVGIKMAGINGTTIEQLLPVAAATGCARALNIAPNWKAAGYTEARLTQAWASVLSVYASAWPDKPLVLQSGGWPMPGGGVAATKALAKQFVGVIGANAVLQNNGWNAAWHWPPSVLGVPVGGQTASAVTGDKSCRMNGYRTPCDAATVMRATIAQGSGLAFREIYIPDLLNTAFATMLKGLPK